MSRRRHSAEEIITKLRAAERHMRRITPGVALERREEATIDRQAMRRALVALGFLTHKQASFSDTKITFSGKEIVRATAGIVRCTVDVKREAFSTGC
jgi:predicted deacylase